MIAIVQKSTNFTSSVRYLKKPKTPSDSILNYDSLGLKANDSLLAQKIVGNLVLLNRDTRSRHQFLHISISFRQEQEGIHQEAIRQIAFRYLKLMKWDKTAYYRIYEHKDKDHQHFHIILLRTQFDGKNINEKFFKKRSMTACKEIERLFELIPAPKHRASRRSSNKIAHAKAHKYELTFTKIWDKLDACRNSSTTLEEYIAQAEKNKIDVRIKEVNKQPYGVSYSVDLDENEDFKAGKSIVSKTGKSHGKSDKFIVTGKKLGYDYMIKGLQAKFHDNVEQGVDKLKQKIVIGFGRYQRWDAFTKYLTSSNITLNFDIPDRKAEFKFNGILVNLSEIHNQWSIRFWDMLRRQVEMVREEEEGWSLIDAVDDEISEKLNKGVEREIESKPKKKRSWGIS